MVGKDQRCSRVRHWTALPCSKWPCLGTNHTGYPAVIFLSYAPCPTSMSSSIQVLLWYVLLSLLKRGKSDRLDWLKDETLCASIHACKALDWRRRALAHAQSRSLSLLLLLHSSIFPFNIWTRVGNIHKSQLDGHRYSLLLDQKIDNSECPPRIVASRHQP